MIDKTLPCFAALCLGFSDGFGFVILTRAARAGNAPRELPELRASPAHLTHPGAPGKELRFMGISRFRAPI